MNKLAVVIPVFNTERYFDKCLSSIKRQSFTNFEVFIVDDGSTDASNVIARHYSRQDKRFHVFQKENSGVSSARNAALDIIASSKEKFEYIYFCDSDDFLDENAFEVIITKLDECAYDYAVFSLNRFTKSSRYNIITRYTVDQILQHDEIAKQYFKAERKWKHHSTADCFLNNKIFRYSCVKGIRFNESLKRSGDFDFFLKVLPNLQRGILTETVRYHYRLRKGSITGSVKRKGDFDACRGCFERSKNYSSNDLKLIARWLIRSVYVDGAFLVTQGQENIFLSELHYLKSLNLPIDANIGAIKYQIILSFPICIQRILFKLRKMIKKNNSKLSDYYE